MLYPIMDNCELESDNGVKSCSSEHRSEFKISCNFNKLDVHHANPVKASGSDFITIQFIENYLSAFKSAL